MISDMGSKVRFSPDKAHSELTQAFSEHLTRRAVAEQYGVNEATVTRWIDRLKRLGYGDPRE